MKQIFENIIKYFKRKIKYYSLRRRSAQAIGEMHERMQRFADSDMAFAIVKAFAIKPGSEVMYAPVSGEFYIVNEQDDQFAILTSYSLLIINGVYQYHVEMPEESTEYLGKYLKRIIERKRMKVKKKIESKVDNSLKTILEKVKTK